MTTSTFELQEIFTLYHGKQVGNTNMRSIFFLAGHINNKEKWQSQITEQELKTAKTHIEQQLPWIKNATIEDYHKLVNEHGHHFEIDQASPQQP